jgi:outer membrane protein assembly factor BamB
MTTENGTYRNPPRYPPVPSPYVTPTRPRRRFVPLMLLLAVLASALFGVSYLVSPEPDVRVQPGFAFAEVDGRDVVLVPYERHWVRGMFQLLGQDMFQVRLAAADPATGEVLWDTQLSDELIWEASVLAAGRRYAYVATDSGLAVVALADGSVVAKGDGVHGLGAAFLAARTAYAYDPAGRRVLAMNATGDVLAIGLDQTAAVPVDAPTAAAWSTRLSAEPSTAARPDATAKEAALGPERIVLRDLPFGIPGSVLVRVTPDGLGIPIGGTAFHGAQLVVDGGTAVGAGHVLVQHRRSVNEAGPTLSAVSLATGQVTSSLAVQSQVERAVVGPHGTAAVAAREVFAVLHGDGRVVRLDIGAADFFGSPS